MKTILTTILTTSLLASGFMVSAQSNNDNIVQQNSLDWANNLHTRAHIDFMIPYTQLDDGLKLPIVFTVEASYHLKNIAQVRAAAHIGTFKGVTVGGLLPLKDKLVTKKTRFLVSETNEKVTFYKGKSEFRSIFGLSADLKVGAFDNSGLYARLQGGFEWKSYSRAYYKGYGSSRNGAISVKLQGVAAKLNMSEVHDGKEAYKSRFGIGGMAGIDYNLRPWKRVTLYGGVDLGYLYIPGVEDDKKFGIKNEKGMPLLEIRLGASVRL